MLTYSHLINFLRWAFYVGSILSISPALKAQPAIVTQPLSFSASCPGSTITVPFSLTGTYTTSTVFTVQLSNGGDYKDITTAKTLLGGPASGRYEIRATLPSDLVPGTNYTLRVTTSNPVITGSSTSLIIKGIQSKPAPPLVDSVTVTCQRFTSTSFAELYAPVDVTLTAGATPRLYYDNTFDQFTQELVTSECGNLTSLGQDSVECKRYGYFRTPKRFYSTPSYVYPVNESTYYVSQLIDGCESDKVSTLVRTLYRPSSGPTPTNPYKPGEGDPHYGRLTYCQGDRAFPLNVNGHSAPPANYQVAYNYGSSQQTTVPPIPDTRMPGVTRYSLGLVPVDYSKSCPLPLSSTTYVVVTVNPRPVKPPTTTPFITFNQGQAASPLSASLTDTTATLVWYGPGIPGDSVSKIAPTPSTGKVGIFTYYVAQRIDACESERAAITITVNAPLGTEDPALSRAVDVYPNPVVTKLTVQIRGLSAYQHAQLTVLDANGRMVLSKDTQRETTVLDLDSYPAGHYLLRITVGDRMTTRRIVVM